MKYPLSDETIEEMGRDIVQNHLTQKATIQQLVAVLTEALEDSSEDNEWYQQAHSLVENLKNKKVKKIVPKVEESFGEEMSEDDIAAFFKEPKVKKKKTKKLKNMTLEEIESWEKAQNNSNDIYRVSARIKNLARDAIKANLTAQGDMVVNSFTHVVKAFYDFAETVADKETKIKLIELARKQEEAPANLLAALGSGVKLGAEK